MSDSLRQVRPLTFGLFAFVGFAAAAPAQEKEPEHLLLIFAGQSNMGGKGTTHTAANLTDEEKAVIPNVKGFYCKARANAGPRSPPQAHQRSKRLTAGSSVWKSATSAAKAAASAR